MNSLYKLFSCVLVFNLHDLSTDNIFNNVKCIQVKTTSIYVGGNCILRESHFLQITGISNNNII